MRMLLKLKAHNKYITPNYNYQLSSAIYNLLRLGSSEFAEFLHTTGYKQNKRTYKLFTFSLQFDKISIEKGKIKLLSPRASLYIDSAITDDFITNFVLGSFGAQTIHLQFGKELVTFEIEQAETLPEPQFGETAKFKLLSPIVLSTMKDTEVSINTYYLRYNDDMEEINRILNQNLINKYELIHNSPYNGGAVKLSWDDEYIKRRKARGKRLTKKISVLKSGERPIEIVGNEIPFTLTGSPELMKVGYSCGFGEKNSMGFGMAEVV